jgi:hypothetical protein
MSDEPLDDIDTLLVAADEDIDDIASMYKASLATKQVPQRLRADIKNVLENPRSVLDYLAVAITEKFGTPRRSICYPLATSDTDLARRMVSAMSGVAEKRKRITKKIGDHQLYNSPWLKHLSTLVRENKHNRLTPQERRQNLIVAPTAGGAGYIGTPGAGIALHGNSLSDWKAARRSGSAAPARSSCRTSRKRCTSTGCSRTRASRCSKRCGRSSKGSACSPTSCAISRACSARAPDRRAPQPRARYRTARTSRLAATIATRRSRRATRLGRSRRS